MIRLLVFTIVLWMPSCLLGDITVTFSPSKEVPAEIVKAIDSAVWTLDIAIYNLDHKGILESIEQASKDGVRVRVILNRPDKELKTAERLEASGADVRHVNMVMHHKFLIADSSLLVTGSGNWTNNAFLRYDEDLLTMRNEAAYTTALVGEFESLWNWSKEFGKTIYEPSKLLRSKPQFGRAVFTSENMFKKERSGERIFSTSSKLEEGVCGLQLIDGINKAESTIDIATTHFRRGDISEALKKAMDRGVEVRLLLDMQEYHAKNTKAKNVLFDEQLSEDGAAVRYKCYSTKWTFQTAYQLHCKYMLVDSRTVFTGSLNWSANSENESIENLLILDRPQLAKQYSNQFKHQWNYGKGSFLQLLQQLKSDDVKLPLSFEPISLSAEQVKRVLRNR